MTSAADQPALVKPTRSLTGFYAALGIIVVLGLFGAWFWRSYSVWWFDADEAKRRQAEAAAKLGLPVEKSVDLGDGVKLELVLVPAGRFQMGSPVPEVGGGKQHWVVITHPFYMGRYEVTQEQWEKVRGAHLSNLEGARNPVEWVSWDDSQEFLRKVNALGKERGQFRLPTEAEWEWACRAGTRTRFCFGDEENRLAEYGWCSANSGRTAHPVGMKKPNAWGLHDMHGNVWEWCWDWHSDTYYTKSPKYDPPGPVTGAGQEVRGGSWNDDAECCRSSYRSCSYLPGGRILNFGFRVVMVPAGR
jgi:formylglycine-generating enzyme required for sulfatase activity